MIRRHPFVLSLATAIAFAVPGTALASEYTIDPAHSNAMFSVKHMMVTTVRGEFEKVTGTLNLNEKDISKSTVNATIDASTIDTDEKKRDDHLRSPDFFDVQKYPTITFKSTKVQKAKGGLKVTGDLTIRDVTRPVVLEVEPLSKPMKDPMGNIKLGTTATTTIKREDFGLKWNRALESGGVLVGNDVKITLDLEFLQAKESGSTTGSK